MDHDEPEDEAQQVITETSERSTFRPSRRDTNSPEDLKPMGRGMAQDIQGYLNYQEDYDKRFAADERDEMEELRSKLRIFEEAEQRRV